MYVLMRHNKVKKQQLFLLVSFILLYLGNESCLQKEAHETVWIFA